MDVRIPPSRGGGRVHLGQVALGFVGIVGSSGHYHGVISFVLVANFFFMSGGCTGRWGDQGHYGYGFVMSRLDH